MALCDLNNDVDTLIPQNNQECAATLQNLESFEDVYKTYTPTNVESVSSTTSTLQNFAVHDTTSQSQQATDTDCDVNYARFRERLNLRYSHFRIASGQMSSKRMSYNESNQSCNFDGCSIQCQRSCNPGATFSEPSYSSMDTSSDISDAGSSKAVPSQTYSDNSSQNASMDDGCECDSNRSSVSTGTQSFLQDSCCFCFRNNNTANKPQFVQAMGQQEMNCCCSSNMPSRSPYSIMGPMGNANNCYSAPPSSQMCYGSNGAPSMPDYGPMGSMNMGGYGMNGMPDFREQGGINMAGYGANLGCMNQGGSAPLSSGMSYGAYPTTTNAPMCACDLNCLDVEGFLRKFAQTPQCLPNCLTLPSPPCLNCNLNMANNNGSASSYPSMPTTAAVSCNNDTLQAQTVYTSDYKPFCMGNTFNHYPNGNGMGMDMGSYGPCSAPAGAGVCGDFCNGPTTAAYGMGPACCFAEPAQGIPLSYMNTGC